MKSISIIRQPICCLVILLAALLGACSSGSPTGIQPHSLTSRLPDGLSRFEYEIPFQETFTLIPTTQLGNSIQLGTFGSDNYVVAWYASGSEGKYAAQTLSGKGVNLKPCAFSTQGSHLVTAEVYSPFDTEMANPLLSADVGFEIDPGCEALRFEEFKLPARSDGSPEDLIVRLQLVDPNGNTILNEAGERPPIRVDLQAAGGTLSQYEGETDPEGYFPPTTATLSEGRDYMDVVAFAEYQPSGGELLTAESPVRRMRRVGSPDDDDDDSDSSSPPGTGSGGSGSAGDPGCGVFCAPSSGGYQCPVPLVDGVCPGGPGGAGPSSGGPPPTAPTPPTPCPDCVPAKSTGDPHLYTFDRRYYEFQAAGEFVLVKSNDGQIEVQTRQIPWVEVSSPALANLASVNSAVAAKLGAERVGIYANRSSQLWVNGEPQTLPLRSSLDLASGGKVFRFPGRGSSSYYLVWPTQELLQVDVLSRSVDVTFHLAPNRRGQVSGLLGDFNGNWRDDIQARTGEIFTNNPIRFDDLYRGFGDSWRVSPTESLFDYDPGESTATFTDPSFPKGVIELTPEQEESAEAICRPKGIRDELLLRACILDVAVTGQVDFAEAFTEVEPPQEGLEVEGSLPLSTMDQQLVRNLRSETRIQTGPIFPSDLEKITRLSLSGVSSLLGLEKSNLSSLRLMDSTYGFLESFQGLPPELPRLETLYFTNSALASFQGLPKKLPALREVTLRLSGTSQAELRGLPLELPELKSLNLVGIKSLNGLPKELPKLQSLNVQSSDLASFVGLPQILPSLKTLYSSARSLQGLPLELPSLERLSLSNRNLLTLQGLPVELPNLKGLTVEFTGLSNLQGLPSELASLQFLVLDENYDLISLRGFPQQLPSLEYLALRDSRLSSLQGLPQELPSLRELDLSRAGMSNLQGLPQMPSLMTIWLSPLEPFSLCGVKDKVPQRILDGYGLSCS